MLKVKETLRKILQEFIGTAWADVPSKTISRLRYRKKSGVVFVSGYNNSSEHATGWEVIGVLPEGFRPSESYYASFATRSGHTAEVVVYSSGEINVNRSAAGYWVSFSLSFPL